MRDTGKDKRTGGWRGSADQRAIGRAAIRAWNAKRHLHPKCGAKRKHDGEPCQQIALANGRCAWHGGRVPKGDAWHRPRWPDGKAPDAVPKLNRKLNDLQRAEMKRSKRVARMKPEEREAYETWQRSHRPGSAAARANRREELRQNAETRERLANYAPPKPTAETVALQTLLDDLRAELERLQSKGYDLGVFG